MHQTTQRWVGRESSLPMGQDWAVSDGSKRAAIPKRQMFPELPSSVLTLQNPRCLGETTHRKVTWEINQSLGNQSVAAMVGPCTCRAEIRWCRWAGGRRPANLGGETWEQCGSPAKRTSYLFEQKEWASTREESNQKSLKSPLKKISRWLCNALQCLRCSPGRKVLLYRTQILCLAILKTLWLELEL